MVKPKAEAQVSGRSDGEIGAAPAGKARGRAETRNLLVEATLAVIAEKGFAGANLDEIAAHAGMTKGAIYGNYRSKGELLWAAVGRRGLNLNADLRAGESIAYQARAMAKAVMTLAPAYAREAPFHRELQNHVRIDPDLNARQAAQYGALFDRSEARIGAMFGHLLKIPPRQMVLASQAMAVGFLDQWAKTPDEVTEEVVTAAFEALFVGAMRQP